jgi:tRNA pseudouridine13 synthase
MQSSQTVPYLTAGLAGIGGQIKSRPEDFCVTELPLYEPSGQGTHVYFGLQKRGLSTPAALERIARLLGANPGHFGAAGLKDAQALTEQTVSIEHLDDRQLKLLEGLADERIQVVWVSRHTNKIKPGHLAGNRFAIRIRQVGPEQLAACQAVLEVLAQRGVPNYFGEQRFGRRGDNDRLGRALVAGDLVGFVHLLLGGPREEDPPECRRARELFDAGDYAGALKTWPGRYQNERRALAALVRKGAARAAFAAVDKFSKRLVVSAFQSLLFNRVLARRIDQIDTVVAGDLAQKTDTGGVFLVEDEPAEKARAAAGLISPTGPLFGYRVSLAQGAPGEIERAVLAEVNLTSEDWRKSGAHKVKGMRRPLRFMLKEPVAAAGSDEHGPYIEVGFTAPAGCFATVALREIMKIDTLSAEY